MNLTSFLLGLAVGSTVVFLACKDPWQTIIDELEMDTQYGADNRKKLKHRAAEVVDLLRNQADVESVMHLTELDEEAS